MSQRIAVVGLMGSGKSTLAAELARRLGLAMVDSDGQLRDRFGMAGRRFAELHGIDALHRVEAQLLDEALDRPGGLVVTPAASTIEDDRLRGRLEEEAFVVWLALPIPVLMERIPAGDHRRPVSTSDLEAILARRGPLYAEVADVTITDPLPPDPLTDHVIAALDISRRA